MSRHHQRDQLVDDERSFRTERQAVRTLHALGRRGFQVVRYAETREFVFPKSTPRGRTDYPGKNQEKPPRNCPVLSGRNKRSQENVRPELHTRPRRRVLARNQTRPGRGHDGSTVRRHGSGTADSTDSR